ncbi:MAG: glycoside hydrolase [Clostridiales bacterium]|nr:glycoside hydrolase [Clostridiales bacterium]
MKRILISFFTVVIMAFIIVGAAIGIRLYQKYAPTKEMADLEEWFGVSGDEIAVVVDNELAEGIKGKQINEGVYLPLSWVSNTLNERFYWAEDVHEMIYVLPETIVYADTSATEDNGCPVIVEEEEEVWLNAQTVLRYTDIQLETYVDDAVKRIFIDTTWEPFREAGLKKNGKIRVLGGVKSAILTEVAENENVQILESMEKWTRVRTDSGYIGYIQKRLLGSETEVEQHSTFEAPVYTSLSLDVPVSLIWHQVTSKEANSAMKTLMANTKGINVIAPTWFMLTDNEGNFDSLADASYVAGAHEMGLQVWAVLDNFNRGADVQSEVLFADTAARERLIGALIQEVQTYGIDGINLDIEGIKPAAGVHYIQFIRELSVSCRTNGIFLSVDSYVPSAYTSFYNRAEQGKVADYVVIMGYDEHYAGGEAGSVASIGYERQGILDTLEDVPAEKIISAIPLYTRVWKVDSSGTSSTAMGLASARKWVDDNGVELYWQEELGQYYGEKRTEDAVWYIWLEEERSLTEKVALIKEYGLAGVACWKLGFDTAEIWEIIRL